MTDTTPFWPYALAAFLFTLAFLALPLLVAAAAAFIRRRRVETDRQRGQHVPPQLRGGSTPRRLEGQHRP